MVLSFILHQNGLALLDRGLIGIFFPNQILFFINICRINMVVIHGDNKFFEVIQEVGKLFVKELIESQVAFDRSLKMERAWMF